MLNSVLLAITLSGILQKYKSRLLQVFGSGLQLLGCNTVPTHQLKYTAMLTWQLVVNASQHRLSVGHKSGRRPSTRLPGRGRWQCGRRWWCTSGGMPSWWGPVILGVGNVLWLLLWKRKCAAREGYIWVMHGNSACDFFIWIVHVDITVGTTHVRTNTIGEHETTNVRMQSHDMATRGKGMRQAMLRTVSCCDKIARRRQLRNNSTLSARSANHWNTISLIIRLHKSTQHCKINNNDSQALRSLS